MEKEENTSEVAAQTLGEGIEADVCHGWWQKSKDDNRMMIRMPAVGYIKHTAPPVCAGACRAFTFWPNSKKMTSRAEVLVGAWRSVKTYKEHVI